MQDSILDQVELCPCGLRMSMASALGEHVDMG